MKGDVSCLSWLLEPTKEPIATPQMNVAPPEMSDASTQLSYELFPDDMVDGVSPSISAFPPICPPPPVPVAS